MGFGVEETGEREGDLSGLPLKAKHSYFSGFRKINQKQVFVFSFFSLHTLWVEFKCDAGVGEDFHFSFLKGPS